MLMIMIDIIKTLNNYKKYHRVYKSKIENINY